jgi:tetratricopeptide (TPR) repeat protein
MVFARLRLAARNLRWLDALVVASAVVVAFSASLRNEFVSWDDYANLVENPAYRGFSPSHLRWMFTTFHMGPYQPLSWLSLAVDHLVWGMNPRGYHLSNLLLHAANAALLCAGLRSLLARLPVAAPPARLRTAAALGALFWAVHPLRVESVAWATERRDVLSGFFFLLAVIAYLRAHSGLAPVSRLGSFLPLGWFAASLLAKASGMTLPALLLVLDVYPLRRFAAAAGNRAALRRILAEKLPYAALALAAALAAVIGQQRAQAMDFVKDHGLLDRCMQAAFGLCFYVWKTLAPVRLSPLYLLEQPFDPLRPRYLVYAAVVLGVTALLFAARRSHPGWLAAWVAYAALAAPFLGFAQSGWQIAADRYTYLASLPFSALLAAGLAQVPAHARGRPLWRHWATSAAIALVVLGLGVQSFRQTRVWHDGQTLWNYVLALDPENWFAFNSRGKLYQQRGDPIAARADYDRAIALNPDYAVAPYNRAMLRDEQGDFDGALRDLEAALSARPDFSEAYDNRGAILEEHGQIEAALRDYDAAIRTDPENFGARYNRARLLHRRGDHAAALRDLDAAIALSPRQAFLYDYRGKLKWEMGDRLGALRDRDDAIRLARESAPAD